MFAWEVRLSRRPVVSEARGISGSHSGTLWQCECLPQHLFKLRSFMWKAITTSSFDSAPQLAICCNSDKPVYVTIYCLFPSPFPPSSSFLLSLTEFLSSPCSLSRSCLSKQISVNRIWLCREYIHHAFLSVSQVNSSENMKTCPEVDLFLCIGV